MGLRRNRRVWELKSYRNQQGWQNFIGCENSQPCEISQPLLNFLGVAKISQPLRKMATNLLKTSFHFKITPTKQNTKIMNKSIEK